MSKLMRRSLAVIKHERTAREAGATKLSSPMGLVERGGRIVAGPIPDDTISTMEPIISQHVEIGSRISTGSYSDLTKIGYKHETVNYSAMEYVRDDTHTNSLEGYWSLLKRSINGTHTHVSQKRLWKYVAEFSYRRNFRDSHLDMFNRLVASFSLPRVAKT